MCTIVMLICKMLIYIPLINIGAALLALVVCNCSDRLRGIFVSYLFVEEPEGVILMTRGRKLWYHEVRNFSVEGG